MKATFISNTLLAVGLIVSLCLDTNADIAQQTEIHIRSVPTGASITLNGRTAGVTPLSLPAFASGRHLLTASMMGYRTLYQTVDVNPGERRVLELTLDPLTGLLLVHSTPPGAEIEVNGVHRGTTPALITDLPIGVHRVELTRPGHLPRRLDVAIEGRPPKRLHAVLTADTAAITVTTRPSGATVSIDGIRQETTPCTINNVRTGEVSLQINASGHRPFSETILLRAGDDREIDITLQPEPSSLSVSTTPPGARVFINDRFRGRSPVQLSDIPAGEYFIRTELEAHDAATRSVRVNMGRDHVEEITLTPNAGRLEITTEPAGATVLLNGVSVGETVPEPDKTDNLSARFVIPLVPVGVHELSLTRVGYFPLATEIHIARNETHIAHYNLERRFIPNVQIQTRTETYRGILVERNVDSLKLELRPGIFKTLLNTDIITITPLRAPEIPDHAP